MQVDAQIDIRPCDFFAATRLVDELGVSFPLAQIFCRRGFTSPAAARAFLSAADAHPPQAFQGIEDAQAVLLSHARAGTQITVHGDYDVDGICSTAILVRALRTLGATVDWYLPSRSEDGYGLQVATVERLASRGTRLIVTADCAITAVEAVARARALGVDVVVTDHHTPRADGALPDCPIVHPAICGYPCADLCAAGVAYKFVTALGVDAEGDLDLVALATVADCVPLLGENRRLVRAGLAALAATPKPGLRALMRVAKVDAGTLDARAIGFRLAPRLNAAGRMQRADTGLELVLTEDDERARRIAEELDALNVDRRHTEERIRFAAETLVTEFGEQPAYVLAGEDWHPGVIGIVAARIAERHHRPVVMIALDGEDGTGSGRSIPAFDLLAGLDASAGHLLGHGGHRAAAGCTIRRDQVDAFREAFCAHAAAVLSPEDLVPRERVDAVVAGDELGVALAEELAQLAPFGIANPQPVLYVPGARLSDPKPMGEGKHLRFTVEAGGVRARAVAFGTTSLPSAEVVDATFGLELNAWNGAVEPRLLLRRAQEPAPAPLRLLEPVSWGEAMKAEWGAPLVPWGVADEMPRTAAVRHGPSLWDRRGGGAAGVIAALVASGEPVAVLVADVPARERALAQRVGGFVLASWRALERGLAVDATHVIALDPPPHPSLLHHATVLAWGESELEFSLHVHEHLHALREPLAAAYRALRDGDGALDALSMHPVLAARVVHVLDELGLVAFDGERAPVLPGAGRRDLADSATFRAAEARLAEGRRWLTRSSPARAA